MLMLFWILAAYGMTTILVYGSIFESTRDFIIKHSSFFGKLITCVLCTSTWVGFFFGIFLYSPVHELLDVNPYVSWFFDGMLASGSVWAINAIVEWFETNRPKN